MDNTTFISKWRIIGDDRTLTLPLIDSGQYDFDVDWGDNYKSHITSPIASHTYHSQGIYQVSITGLIKGWKAFDTSGYKLIDVSQWGCLKLGNNGFYFLNCTELDITASDAPDLSETTNLRGMFSYCRKFNSKIGHWDVSRVTCMRSMFYDASSFNQPIGGWDVSRVTEMYAMFSKASSFNQVISNWDVSKVTNMDHMFGYASSFNHDISKWDVSNVIDMGGMFNNASSFNQDISNWDVSSVTNMWGMFSQATVFNQPIDRWNVSRVTCMNNMFFQASSFNQDISHWDVSNIKGMHYMLAGATAFVNGPYLRNLENWNVSPDLLVRANILGTGKTIPYSSRHYILSWNDWSDRHPNKSGSEYTCLICLTDLPMDNTWRAITCPATITEGIPHCFHKECFEEWFNVKQKEHTCPVCRRKAKAIR